VKFGRVVFEIYEQTDIQKYQQTTQITILHIGPRSQVTRWTGVADKDFKSPCFCSSINRLITNTQDDHRNRGDYKLIHWFNESGTGLPQTSWKK